MMNDKKKNQKQANTALRWIIRHSRRYTGWILLLSFLGIMLSLISVGFALVSKEVIDIATGQAGGVLSGKILTLAVLIFFQLLCQVLISVRSVRTGGHLGISMKQHVFTTLLTRDYLKVTKYHSGELLNRIQSDVSLISNGIINLVPSLLSLLAQAVAGFLALFYLDRIFAVMMLIICPFVALSSRLYSKHIKTLHRKTQEAEGKSRSFMQEALQNLLVIKSFRNEKAVSEQSTELQFGHLHFVLKRNTISILANLFYYVTLTAGYYLALSWGAYRISLGLMSFGTVTAMLQIVNQVQTPFKNMSGLLPQYYNMLASAERIIELETLSPEKSDNVALPEGDDLYQGLHAIEMKEVTFIYDQEPVLQKASLRVQKGEFIAIAGISGIGKSTFLKLLLGILSPTDGALVLETESGELSADAGTRGLFAYVPQGNMILSGTIRDNIRFFRPETDDRKIEQCARDAEIWDFIESLPEGLDTVLGEKGLGLSEGQVQRLAIARALYYGAPVLLLDEATSALDEETEAKVLQNLRALTTKTCIIVSHKKAALDACDRAVAIRDGQFVPYTTEQ